MMLGVDTGITEFEKATPGQARRQEFQEEILMKPFHVWVRPLGQNCRVRVDGLDNGSWLRDRLIDLAIVDSGQAVGREESIGIYTFLVPYSAEMTRSILAEVLAKIPEVELMCEPA